MKMSKVEFKQLMKECLVEILAEGLGNTGKLKESFSRQQGESHRPMIESRKPADTVSFTHKNLPQVDRKQISEKLANGDPVLASILADTAETTLPVMLMNEGRNQPPPPAGSIESVVAAKNPEDLFGNETASKWAELAFASAQKKF